jgi:hypothetical protein
MEKESESLIPMCDRMQMYNTNIVILILHDHDDIQRHIGKVGDMQSWRCLLVEYVCISPPLHTKKTRERERKPLIKATCL